MKTAIVLIAVLVSITSSAQYTKLKIDRNYKKIFQSKNVDNLGCALSYIGWEYFSDFKDTYTYEKLERNFSSQVLDLCSMWTEDVFDEHLYILRANENLDTYVKLQEFVVDKMIDNSVPVGKHTSRKWVAYVQQIDSTGVIILVYYK